MSTNSGECLLEAIHDLNEVDIHSESINKGHPKIGTKERSHSLTNSNHASARPTHRTAEQASAEVAVLGPHGRTCSRAQIGQESIDDDTTS